MSGVKSAPSLELLGEDLVRRLYLYLPKCNMTSIPLKKGWPLYVTLHCMQRVSLQQAMHCTIADRAVFLTIEGLTSLNRKCTVKEPIEKLEPGDL